MSSLKTYIYTHTVISILNTHQLLSISDKMYPPTHHYADGHPGSIAATGLPENIPKQPYVPHPLLSPHVVAGRVPGRWSTGLCHCCDDPANCMAIYSNSAKLRISLFSDLFLIIIIIIILIL